MKIKYIWMLWGWLYALTALLGLLPSSNGLVVALTVLLGIAFFVTGGLLIWLGNRETRKWVRNCALISLSATLVFLLLNFWSVQASALVGRMLHVLLTLVSAPMMCMQVWLISLFLWACLLFAAVSKLKN